MKTSHTNQTSPPAALRSFWANRCFMAVASIAIAASPAWAQSVRMSSVPLRLTIPVGIASSNFCTLTIPISGLVNQGADTVNLAVTGLPGTGNFTTLLSTNGLQSNLTYTATLIINNDASVAAGDYDMAVEATGAASYRLPIPIQVAYVWSGVNFTNAVSTNFASGGNWKGGVAPSSPTSKVVFNDGGGQAVATGPTNVIISADTELAGIRFANEGSATRAHNIEMQSGATLKISGSGQSFSLLRDNKGLSTPVLVTIAGNGSLVVTNANADVVNLIDNQQVGTLDMRNLNSFRAEVVRFGMGDYRMYPNYYTNGYTGGNLPAKFLPTVFLAKTNLIKCSWVDPNGYADPGIRDYAITLGNNDASASTTAYQFRLGISNAIYADSICWTRRAAGASGGNTYNFIATNSYALFRGIGGGRMTIWSQGDASGVSSGTQNGNVRGLLVDFSLGTVDAMVDKFYLTRYDTNNNGRTIQGFMTLGGAYSNSVFDVNDAYIGNQDAVNLNAGPVASVANAPFGRLTVNSNATFRVNNTLNMGYTISAAGTPNWPENCASEINISSNGVVAANQIRVGGVTKLSVANNIFMNRGRLIVTNGIGDVTKGVNNFTITNGSQLTVYNVSDTAPSIYVTTLNAANVGGSCAVNVPVLTNAIWPVTIPLISYVTANPNIAGLTAGTLPSGVVLQTVVDSNAGAAPNGTINFTFTTNTPKTLVWKGTANSNWDTTSTNWVTQAGGTPSRFTDGDSVVFDNSSAVNAITVVGNVTPGQTAAPYGITMTNDSAHNYSFTGGSVGGSASGYKAGTGSLTINATFSPGFTVETGSVAGVGTMGATALQPGAVMTSFSGTINNGLTVSGASVSISGTVLGGLALQTGSLTNKGTIGDATSGGSVSLQTGVYLLNNSNMFVTVPWNLPTNSILANNGSIEQSGAIGAGGGLTVNGGTFKGTGKIYAKSGTAKPDARVTFGPGAKLEIGNSPNEIATIEIATRLDLNAGSTTVFDVDSSTTNDVILLREPSVQLGHVNFGVGNNQGGTLLINKIGGPAFTPATVLALFDRNGSPNEPENSSPAIPKVTPAPLAGYSWDVSQTITNLLIPVTTPPFMTNAIITDTNGIQSLEFTWPESYRGWRLERQTNALEVGLESPSTNWTTVFTGLGGTNANNLYYPGATNDYSVYYFRQVQTISSTNAPAVFYRLSYP